MINFQLSEGGAEAVAISAVSGISRLREKASTLTKNVRRVGCVVFLRYFTAECVMVFDRNRRKPLHRSFCLSAGL